LGTDRHLLLNSSDAEDAAWVRAVPDDAWVLGSSMSNSPLDLRMLSEYVGAKIDWDPPERFMRADAEASIDARRLIQTVPRDALLALARRILASAESLEEHASDQYITGPLAETRRQLSDLRPARVDPVEWGEAMKSDPTPALSSFEPNADGLADVVAYDQMGTLTGRLTVQSGPQILTLRRDLRRVLRPTRRGRRLLMVDFVSHEPRVALCLAGSPPPLDIYGWFQEERMAGQTRDTAKGAIISTLYGMSPSTLAAKIDCTLPEARALNEAVRVTFGLDKLERRLLSEYASSGGTILSSCGRRITPSSPSPGVLVNSYVQSSAFDAAMAGFRRVLADCAAQMIETFVHFYIHDAMVLELSERDEERLVGIASKPVKIPGFPGEYWAKVKEVTQ